MSMNVFVINPAGKLATLRDKATFIDERIGTKEAFLSRFTNESRPFVLLWHTDPRAGLKIMEALREGGRLPAAWRAAAFFRAERYAGLGSEAAARACREKAGFKDTEVHIVSDRVYDIDPPPELLSRFDNFVRAVVEMENSDLGIPFRLLEPPPTDLAWGMVSSFLGLARGVVRSGMLAEAEVLAAVDWPRLFSDARASAPANRPMPAWLSDSAPEQALRPAGETPPLTGMDFRQLCHMCGARRTLEHTGLQHNVIGLGNMIQNHVLQGEESRVRSVEAMRRDTFLILDRLEQMLALATDQGSPFQREIVMLLSHYIKPEAERFRRSLSDLVLAWFKDGCSFYRQRSDIQKGVASLRQGVAHLAQLPNVAENAQLAGAGAADHFSEFISNAEKLRAKLHCLSVQIPAEVQKS